jgi:serine O-acetyltransferase
LIYPGYFGRQNLSSMNISYHVGELLPKIGERLNHEIFQALCHQAETEGEQTGARDGCEAQAHEFTMRFLEQIPAIRELLASDVQAAYDGDPAAAGLHEVILAYPGVLAISVYRLAHALHGMNVPLLPRIMTEWAHIQTGVDIHPGARIGRSFFIDHATGVVIGETTEIGDNVKLYQGVTLGALSIPKDERGRAIRGAKRHPTVRDNVTIYANAIVLGGETVLGAESVVGGSVFLTSAIPDNCTVSIKSPELRYKDQAKGKDGQAVLPDFDI